MGTVKNLPIVSQLVHGSSSIYLGLSGLSLGNQPLNAALSTTVSGTVNRREEEMYLLPMYRMGSKERGGLSLEFRQEFHGKY